MAGGGGGGGGGGSSSSTAFSFFSAFSDDFGGRAVEGRPFLPSFFSLNGSSREPEERYVVAVSAREEAPEREVGAEPERCDACGRLSPGPRFVLNIWLVPRGVHTAARDMT